MIRIVAAAILILAGWLVPVLRVMQLAVTTGDVPHVSINQVNALCSSTLGQLGHEVSPVVNQDCRQARTASVLVVLCTVAGRVFLVWGFCR